MTMPYEDFIESKRIRFEPVGFDVPSDAVNPMLRGEFQFQADIVRWALWRGRAAVFADCGMGKTPMQLEWARHVVAHTGGNVLILAPLAVSVQTQREGYKFGVDVNVCRTDRDLKPGINITNYERMHYFDSADFDGIVLDESSILKAQFGTMRRQITDFGLQIHYRLCATATPSPNDLVELINHAEFLGIMTEMEIKALYFTVDGNSTHDFRLKRYAEDDFWRWMASWAVALRKPSDLGYHDNGFILPPLEIEQHIVKLKNYDNGMLFVVKADTLSEQRAANRASLDQRVQVTAGMVNHSGEAWLIWCNLNTESEALAVAIPDAVEVKGADSPEHKEWAMLAFSSGEIRVMITKPSIAGFGMNWQHCHNVAFVGLSHSYEQYYQAVRRVWRFGQEHPVKVHIITSEADGAIVQNIERKEIQAMDMFENITRHMAVYADIKQAHREEEVYREDVAKGHGWTLFLGDSIKTIDNIPDDSVGVSVFSPPFPGMYVYTNSPHDMGNVRSIQEMIDQFSFLMAPDKLLRILMPGRSVFIHITQGVAQKGRDGYIGLRDFRGPLIAMMQDHGWIHYGEVTINKNPQVKAIRTRDSGLQFKSLATDSARMHVAMPDMLLQFRKPGENPVPVRAGISERYGNSDGWVTNEQWIEWAHPIWNMWSDISETNVLNVAQARDTNDERHLCPLQLDVIERVVKVWSNPDEIVYSPFTGIGSEGYVALKLGRRFVGGELKESYWRHAQRYLEQAVSEKNQLSIFDLLPIEEMTS